MTLRFFLQVSYSTARPSLNHTACKVGIALCELVCQALLYPICLTDLGRKYQTRTVPIIRRTRREGCITTTTPSHSQAMDAKNQLNLSQMSKLKSKSDDV